MKLIIDDIILVILEYLLQNIKLDYLNDFYDLNSQLNKILEKEDLILLVLYLENYYNLSIIDNDVDKWVTIQSIVDYLCIKMNIEKQEDVL